MATKNKTCTDIVNCACVIHGDVYDWIYVERLYNMLQRNLTNTVRLHVYTEHHRPVPEHMIKHSLIDMPEANGYKKGWWYKMQLFNAQHHSGDMLYFDLDTVIVGNIDWIVSLPTNKFWSAKDFKYLQDSNINEINSSVMWWNVDKFDWIWNKFVTENKQDLIRKHNGDQDYLETMIDYHVRGMLCEDQIISWRWQSRDGGTQFPGKKVKLPGTGTHIPERASVLVFHGQPKPHNIFGDAVLQQHWC